MTFGQRLELGLVRAGFALLRALGPVRASNVAGAVARTIGPRLGVTRVADRNLRRAMPELDEAARRRVVRGVWDNLGRTVGEMAHLPALAETPGDGPGYTIENEAAFRDAASKGALIVVSGHVGNWELLGRAAALRGIEVGLIYRAVANTALDDVLARMRRDGAGGRLTLFPKGAKGARGAMAHLAAGKCLGLLVDQKLNDGIEAPFFGHPAMTAPAAAALALRFRCPIFPVRVIRDGPARLRVVIEAPLNATPDADGPGVERNGAASSPSRRTDEILALTVAVNQILERWIRDRPEQWLWLHRRWPKDR